MSSYQFHENENVSAYLQNLELIDDASSNIQSVQVYKHPDLGKVLIINDEIQHIEKWIPYYHESVVHIPMMFIRKPKNVLILGGGDLFAAEEVLKYRTIDTVILCDHDKNVIEVTRKHYEHANKVLSDKRFHLIIGDAREYIDTCDTKFDLIIDDCFNLVEAFDDDKVFKRLKHLLNSNGICSSLIYRHVFDSATMRKTFDRLISNNHTVLSLVTVPEYPGVLHLLTLWGNSIYLRQNLKKTVNDIHLRDKEFSKKCDLFNPKYCNFYLYLPNYIKEILQKEGSS